MPKVSKPIKKTNKAPISRKGKGKLNSAQINKLVKESKKSMSPEKKALLKKIMDAKKRNAA